MLEIERKFVVKEVPADLDSYPCLQIEQGYLAEDPEGTQVRLRKADERRFLTVKRRCKGGRIEHEVPIPAEWWSRLWPLTEGRRLSKTRFNVPYNGFIIELDVFTGANAGLIVAEVEFPDVDSANSFQPPAWLGEDVTSDPHYSNRKRARE